MAVRSDKHIKNITKGLVSYLKKTNQLNIFPQLVRESLKASQVKSDPNVAMVTTAIKLAPTEITDLEKTLESVFGRDIKVKSIIDTNIIGGMYIKVGDKIIDQTIKHQISSLVNTILK